MTTHRVLLIHGPNLNLLGRREPAIYGSGTLDDLVESARDLGRHHKLDVEALQSNSESEIVGAIQGAAGVYDAVIINAGAFTHYSWAIHDAVRAFDGPVVEVHLSNPIAREEFRHVSVLAGVVDGSISGFGPLGYRLAIEAVSALLPRP